MERSKLAWYLLCDTELIKWIIAKSSDRHRVMQPADSESQHENNTWPLFEVQAIDAQVLDARALPQLRC